MNGWCWSSMIHSFDLFNQTGTIIIEWINQIKLNQQYFPSSKTRGKHNINCAFLPFGSTSKYNFSDPFFDFSYRKLWYFTIFMCISINKDEPRSPALAPNCFHISLLSPCVVLLHRALYQKNLFSIYIFHGNVRYNMIS